MHDLGDDRIPAGQPIKGGRSAVRLAGSGWWGPPAGGEHGGGDVLGWATLGDEGGGASVAGGVLGLVAVEHRVDDHPDVGVGAGDARGCLQAVKARHAHVHHHHVGLEVGGHGDGLQPVGGLADDRQAVVLQQATQRSAHGRGVIGDQHPWRQGRPGGWAGLLAHRRIVPGPVAGSRPPRRRPVGGACMLAGDRHADEVQAKQQGRDGPVERWWVQASRRMGVGVQAWWHPRFLVGVVSLLSRPGPWAA